MSKSSISICMDKVHAIDRPQTAVDNPRPQICSTHSCCNTLHMQHLIRLAYNYDIQYRDSALSCLSCRRDTDESTNNGGVFCVSCVDELPVSANYIATETRHDPILLKVLDLTLSGWPKFVPNLDFKWVVYRPGMYSLGANGHNTTKVQM